MKNFVKLSTIKKNNPMINDEMKRVKAGATYYNDTGVLPPYGIQVQMYGVPPVSLYAVVGKDDIVRQID